ncbi:MAG: class II aldolase/adducin family protein [Chloroflexia bacterium]|nr:class II aldolase/adducin family protein [Chloroflexia bacterium]
MTDAMRRLAEELVAYGGRIAGLDLAPNTQGNLSARDPVSGLVAITPHDYSYEAMTADDIMILDLAGSIVSGWRDTSHETPVHLTVYRERPDVHAIVHTEPTYINVFGVLGRPIPPVVVNQLLAVGGESPVMPFMPSGSEAFGREMLRAMGDRNAVVWANHGCLTIGPDLEAAFRCTVALEGGAKIAYLASALGTPRALTMADLLTAVG